MMMRNSSVSLSFKLETTVSSVGRGNQEAVAGGQCHSKGGRCEEFGGQENQAGQIGASLSQEAVPLLFFIADVSVFLCCLRAYSNNAGKKKHSLRKNKDTDAKDL